MRINKIRYINSKKMFFFLCALIWTENTIVFSLKMILRHLPLIGFLYEYIISAIYIVAFLGSVSYIIKRIKAIDFLLYIVFIVYYVYSVYSTNLPGAKQFLGENWFEIIFLIVTMYFIGLAANNGEIVDFLHKVSILSIYVSAFMLAWLIRGNPKTFQESAMGFSYSVLAHISLVFSYLFENKAKGSLLACIIGAFTIVAYGERGPLLLLILYVVTYLIVFREYKHRTRAMLLVASIGGLLVIFVDSIIAFAMRILESVGASTRSIQLFLSGEYFTGNGREVIYVQIWTYIMEKKFSGYGLAADRYITKQHNTIFPYAHNIVLELWMCFGMIIGTVLFVLIVYIIIRGLINAKDKKVRFLILCLAIGPAFIRLFVSGSYLITKMFFFIIGLSVACIRSGKRAVY